MAQLTELNQEQITKLMTMFENLRDSLETAETDSFSAHYKIGLALGACDITIKQLKGEWTL